MTSLDLPEFAKCAKNAVLAGSEVLRRYFGTDGGSLKAKEKEDKTIQTRADVESEQVILSILEPYLNECSVCAEETGADREYQSRYLILVDPLDGTSNYVRARDGFGISVAMVDLAGDLPRVITATTYEPGTKRLWTAIRNQGCWLEVVGQGVSRPVHVSQTLPSKGDLCYDASTSPRDVVLRAQHKARVVAAVIPFYKRFRMLGSNVLAHALVANGSFEAAVTDTVGGPFDIAGHLLVEEAGGCASNLRGEPVNVLADKVIVTSNGIEHEQLVDLLRRLYLEQQS